MKVSINLLVHHNDKEVEGTKEDLAKRNFGVCGYRFLSSMEGYIVIKGQRRNG